MLTASGGQIGVFPPGLARQYYSNYNRASSQFSEIPYLKRVGLAFLSEAARKL